MAFGDQVDSREQAGPAHLGYPIIAGCELAQAGEQVLAGALATRVRVARSTPSWRTPDTWPSG